MEYTFNSLQITLALSVTVLIILLLVGGLLFLYFSTNKSKNTIIELKEEALDEIKQQNKELKANVIQVEEKAVDLQKENDQYQALAGELRLRETQLSSQKKALTEQLNYLELQNKKLEDTFASLSEKVLKARQQDFEKTNSTGMSRVVAPLTQAFESFQKRADAIHDANIEGQAALRNELDNLKEKSTVLGRNAENLSRALRQDKKKLGNWGEQQLERLLENSGLNKDCFRREANFKTEEGENRRPDFVIDLPENKHLIIDSKVSLKAYVDAVNTEDETESIQLLNEHVQNIRNHIDNLASKSYNSLPGINSPDFSFMFMPNEAAFLAAFEHQPSLFDYAYSKRISVVTPTTLMPILGTVNSLWRINKQNQSTEILAKSAERVHDKLRIFMEKFQRIGTQLDSARKAFDGANTSLRGKGSLTNCVENFKEQGVKIMKTLPAPLPDEIVFNEEEVVSEEN